MLTAKDFALKDKIHSVTMACSYVESRLGMVTLKPELQEAMLHLKNAMSALDVALNEYNLHE